MCIAKRPDHRTNLQAKYDEQDGSVNENVQSNHIPNDIPEHVDNPFINTDIEEGILGFVYETKDESVTVWTSEEACYSDTTATSSLDREID